MSAEERISYSLNAWQRLRTVCRVLRQTEQNVVKLKSEIESNLSNNEGKRDKKADLQSIRASISDLDTQLECHKRKVMTAKARLRKGRLARDQSCSDTQAFEDSVKLKMEELAEKQSSYISLREQFVRTSAQLVSRRRQLLEHLRNIYPIIILSNQPNTHSQIPITPCLCTAVYTIANVHLPDAENLGGHNDLDLGIGYGYVVHLVTVMAKILDVPLRYTSNFIGSRSTVEDRLSYKLNANQQIYPLFSKGQDRLAFEYGVFLFNKNIGQLRNDCLLTTKDLRRTLENLASLLEHLCGAKTVLLMGHIRPLSALGSESQPSHSSNSSERSNSILRSLPSERHSKLPSEVPERQSILIQKVN